MRASDREIMIEYQMSIGGEGRNASSGAVLAVSDPFTGEDFATIPDATATDVDDAIAAARDSFETTWSRVSGVDRARMMNRLADLIDERADELGMLETRDNGKLVRETTGQARFAARNYRYFAGWADKLTGKTIPLDAPDFFDYTVRQPLGVAALITAWNSPMQLLANKLAPALAAGNTVVIKPSEHASVTTMVLAELVEKAGFPAGVVNIISGGVEAGTRLTSHPGLDRISFTGSVPVGQAIAAATAKTLVPVTLELGGKSPNIIFEDADIDRAIRGALVGIFSAGGQTCIAGSRLLVQRSVYDRVVAALADRASAIRLGDPKQARTQMGPVANRAQFERVNQRIRDGVDSSARMVAGGSGERARELPSTGLFVPPTVFADVDNQSSLARDEIFGPVLSIIPFDTEDEAISVANTSDFGLASGIWTQNLSRAHRVASALVAGTVWVNTYRMSAAQAPFGGVKKSGFGRERGEEALGEYLRTKNVMINLGDDGVDPFAVDEEH